MSEQKRGEPFVGSSREELFWARVQPEPNTGCWLWAGSTFQSGYGRIGGKHRRTIRAHRFSYEHLVGPIPDGQIVRHTCDVPCCVNPDHLALGTHADNTLDKIQRGRMLVGEKAPRVTLTARQVLQIRAIGYAVPAWAVAKQFGVSRGCIEKVRIGQVWKHLPISREAALAKLSEALEEIEP